MSRLRVIVDLPVGDRYIQSVYDMEVRNLVFFDVVIVRDFLRNCEFRQSELLKKKRNVIVC